MIVLLNLWLGWLPILAGDLAHYFIEAVCADGFYALLLVYIIYWHSLVLEGKEKEQHLVNFLLVPMRLFLGFTKLEPLLFNLDKKVNFARRQLVLNL